ncbi:MAG: hypothetical protein LBE11_07405 [Prevotellaceae bacterium]|jgi:hypothetical protein|nr:hypothetical protein [Prevotellaceae bacterium]
MKKTLLTLIFVFATAILFAQKEEYRREINKDFSVEANAKLSISNIYGNVNIVEGSENRIVFKIEIKGKGKNAKTVKEYAEDVNVDFTSNNNHVLATTKFPKMKCENCGISVDYVVVVPRSATMNFDIKYGNLVINNTPKPLSVEILYGNFKANTVEDVYISAKYGDVKFEKCNNLTATLLYGDLTATTISKAIIDTKYGNINFSACGDTKITSLYSDINADVTANTIVDVKYAKVAIGKCNKLTFKSLYADFKSNSVADANINIGYADVEIGTCKDLLLKSLYTKFKLGEISSIKADSKYDEFTVKTINDFAITTALYTDIIIDRLNNSFTASSFTYCDLIITNIDKDFSKITANNGLYSDFKLGLTEQHNFKANISGGDDGDINTGKIKFNNVTVSKNKNTIVGTAGKSDNPKAEVKISANYGDIVFK